MPRDRKVEIQFVRFHLHDAPRTFGTPKVRFTITANGQQIGDPTTQFNREKKSSCSMPTAGWSIELDVDNTDTIQLSVNVIDYHHAKAPGQIGNFTQQIAFPFQDTALKLDNNYITLEFTVKRKIGGQYGPFDPEEIFAARTGVNGTTVTTVGGQNALRVEICPVRPVFADTEMAARKRPLLPAGSAWKNYDGGGWIGQGSPVNVIPNPAVIPIVPQNSVTAANAARLEVTYYHPDSMNFSDNDNRLKWIVVSGGGQAKFLVGTNTNQDHAYGLKVLAYGTQPGSVTFRLSYENNGHSHNLAEFKAMVKPIGKVKYRVNLLYATGDFRGDGTLTRIPQTMPANVAAHIAAANRYLRQAGIELVPDTNTTVTDNAVATTVTGVFEIDLTSRIADIRNVGSSSAVAGYNRRAGVLSLQYVQSLDGVGEKGVACSFPDSPLGAQSVNDAGSPSHSWVAPSGVWPDGAAAGSKMDIFGSGKETTQGLAAILISDLCGWFTDTVNTTGAQSPGISADAKKLRQVDESLSIDDYDRFVYYFNRKYRGETVMDQQRWEAARLEWLATPLGASGPTGTIGIANFGQTIAHEVTHALNVRHRNMSDKGDDGITFPPKQNLMTYASPFLAQNVDVLQAVVMHASSLVDHT